MAVDFSVTSVTEPSSSGGGPEYVDFRVTFTGPPETTQYRIQYMYEGIENDFAITGSFFDFFGYPRTTSIFLTVTSVNGTGVGQQQSKSITLGGQIFELSFFSTGAYVVYCTNFGVDMYWEKKIEFLGAFSFAAISTLPQDTYEETAPTQSYYLRVRRNQNTPDSIFSLPFLITKPPLGLSASNITQTDAQLVCNSTDVAANVIYERSTNPTFNTLDTSHNNAAGIILSGLLPDTLYYARCYYTQYSISFDGERASNYSDVITFRTLALSVLPKPEISLIVLEDPSAFPGMPAEFVGIQLQATIYGPEFGTITYNWEVVAGNQQGGGGEGGLYGLGTWYSEAAARGTRHGYRVTAYSAGFTNSVSDIFYITIAAQEVTAPGYYEQWQPTLAPPWLQRPNGLSYNAALGYTKDQTVYALLEAALQRFPQFADEQALGLIAGDRNLERYPGESVSTLRRRLLGAWEFWRQAGTVPGVIEAMRQLGYRASILELRNVDPLKWSQFIVIIRPLPGSVLGGAWGSNGVWGQPADELWGGGFTLAQLNAIRRLLRKVKPAHTWIPQLYIITSGGLWGEEPGAWGAVSQPWGGGGAFTIADGIQGVT